MSEPGQYQDSERLDLPSGSGMYIVVRCPGQPKLRNSLPPEAFKRKQETPDEWAERGSRIHKAFETGNTQELDAEEAETYRLALQFEDSIVQNWMRDKNLEDCWEGPRETRYWLHNPTTLEPIGSAKPDRHYVSPPHLLVIDLKSGWNPNLPPSPASWQLRFQAVALWEEYRDRGITSIRVAHCVPKSQSGASDVCDYSQVDLEFSVQALLVHLWEAAQPNAPRHAGNWCNWCPCKAYCAEAGAYSLLPSVIATKADRRGLVNWEQAVATMAGPDLYRVWEASTIIEKIVEAVKQRLKAMKPEQLAELGLELGKGRQLVNVGDIPSAFGFLTKQFEEKDILNCMNFGRGALVELARQKRGMTKEAATLWLDAALNAWIVRETSERPLKKLKA